MRRGRWQPASRCQVYKAMLFVFLPLCCGVLCLVVLFCRVCVVAAVGFRVHPRSGNLPPGLGQGRGGGGRARLAR